ncbi:MAG: Uma2 family endonuclease [Pseudomonadota bacterium]
MTLKIDIAGEEIETVPLDRTAVEVMIDHGALPNDGRVELVDGILRPMPPSYAPHAAAVIEIGHAIRTALGRSRQILADPAFFLSDDTMFGPDLFVLPRDVELREATGRDVDLLVEISQTTLAYDLRLKAERYGRAGVADYWVVDLDNRLLHVHRTPRADGYASVEQIAWDRPVTALRLPALTLTLAEVLA